MNKNIKILNILDMISSAGEESVKQWLSCFCCPINKEIENFIRSSSIDLDCEDKPELRSFYEKKVNFRYFGTRISESDNRAYLQYIKFL